MVHTLDPAAGGPPQVAVRMAAAQAALGHQIHLVSHAGTENEHRVLRQIEHVPNHSRIAFHSVPPPNRLERILPLRTRRLLRELYVGADFVHIHGIWGNLLLAAAQTAHRNGIPYCFRPAGMLDPWSLGQKAWKKKIALMLGYRSALAESAFIQMLNADEQRLIAPLELGVPSVVLPNGVFLEEIEPLPQPGTFRRSHPKLGSFPFVLFLSRLHQKKGLDVLCDAFAILARRGQAVHLVVAGPDEGGRGAFVQQMAATGFAGRVHLVGALYGRDKFAALVDAACFCLPSRQEGFSVAITEAMACGAPVVISEGCHFPEVGRVGAGIVLPLDATRFASALEEVITDRPRAAAMGAAGAALVRSRYTWGAIAERSIDFYQRASR